MRALWIIGGLAVLGIAVSSRRVRDGVGEAVNVATTAITDLIERFEGFSATVYQDAAGLWTIGYGHLVKPGEPYHPYGPVKEITREQAAELFERDTAEARACVDGAVTVALTENQRAALVSFVFNVGCGAFRTSTLLAKLNRGDYDGAAAEFGRWKRAGGRVVPGLVARRATEAELFLTA